MSDLKLDVATPERVAVALPIAGIGFRALAYLVDVAVLFAVTITLYFLYSLVGRSLTDLYFDLSQVVRVLALLGAFFVMWVYWTLLEVLWHGQTLGKRLLRIRVVRADGSPVTAIESALRNLLRLIDFLPSCYPVGIITMLLDRQHRRLGDLVAGTVIVREQSYDLSRYLLVADQGPASHGPTLSRDDQALASSFLARFDTLEPEARSRLAAQVAVRLKLEGDADNLKRRLEPWVRSGDTTGALATFVVKRKPEWDQLTQLLDRLTHRQRSSALTLGDLATLDRLYRHVSADLAHAQTFAAGTDVHWALNQLTGRAYRAIYRGAPERVRALRHFFRLTFPQAVRDNLRVVGLSAALLVLGIIIGATTVAFDPDGARLLVNEDLRSAVAHHELWTDGVLAQHTPAEMATLIFTNNLKVAFMAFALGLTAGLGTVWVMLSNGISVGALVTHCVQNGLGPGIFDFMAAHGWVELSIICICGGAGLLLGQALISPGERPRAEALREQGRVAVQLVLGCAPFLVGIGIIEGFVSPGPLFPWWLKGVLGLALGAGFWSYLLQSGREMNSAPHPVKGTTLRSTAKAS